jgi:hypothetical protein
LYSSVSVPEVEEELPGPMAAAAAAAPTLQPATIPDRVRVRFNLVISAASPPGNTTRPHQHHQEDPNDPFIHSSQVFIFYLAFICITDFLNSMLPPLRPFSSLQSLMEMRMSQRHPKII